MKHTILGLLAVGMTLHAGAVNVEDYLADGIGSWTLVGDYNKQAAILNIDITPTGGEFRTVSELSIGDQSEAVRIDTRTHANGVWGLTGVTGDDLGSFAFKKPIGMMPLNAESGEWNASFKKENASVRKWVEYTQTLHGLADIEFMGEVQTALVMDHSWTIKTYDPAVNPANNWKHDLLSTVTDTWTYFLVEGYGPVRIDIMRSETASGATTLTQGKFRLHAANEIMQSVAFEDAREISPGVWYSTWFGLFETADYPVIDHAIFGETIVEGTSEDFWLRLPEGLGWGNSSRSLWPKMWITGLTGFFDVDLAASNTETLFLRDVAGSYSAVSVADGKVVGIEKRSPTTPSISIFNPLTGRLDFDSSRRLMVSARTANIAANQIRQIYFVLGTGAGDPVISNSLTGTEVHMVYVLNEQQRNTEITITAVLVDQSGKEYTSKPVRLSLYDQSFLPPAFQIEPINATTRTGDLFAVELVVNRPATFSVVSGSLPEGVEIVPNPGGTTAFLTGIPTSTGIYRSIIRASNNAGAADLICVIYVGGGNKPRVISSSTAYGRVGQGFAYTFRISDSTSYGEMSVSLSGLLPDGLVFDDANMTISGVPTMFGEWDIAAFVSNTYGSQPFTLHIVVAP